MRTSSPFISSGKYLNARNLGTESAHGPERNEAYWVNVLQLPRLRETKEEPGGAHEKKKEKETVRLLRSCARERTHAPVLCVLSRQSPLAAHLSQGIPFPSQNDTEGVRAGVQSHVFSFLAPLLDRL